MKKEIFYITLVLALFSCSEGGSDSDSFGANQDIQQSGTTDGQGGSLATFAMKGDYLYVVDHFKLNVFNIAETYNPVKVNQVNVGFAIETIFSYKDYLYIGSRNGMFIYGLSNPETPIELSSVSHFTACDPVIANDSIAYVTLHTNTGCGNNINVLELYDVRDVRNPQLLNRRNLASPKGLGLYRQYLVVCDDEIKIFDVNDPNAYSLESSINQVAFDVIIRGDLLIAIGENGLYQYLLSENANGLQYEHLSTIDI